MSEKQSESLLTGFRWIINILVVIVGFFVTQQLKAIDHSINQIENRVDALEYYKAGAIERDNQILEKLDKILLTQTEWAKNIENFYYLNPELKKPGQ